ncbi:unnamed protein product [Brassica oleracea]
MEISWVLLWYFMGKILLVEHVLLEILMNFMTMIYKKLRSLTIYLIKLYKSQTLLCASTHSFSLLDFQQKKNRVKSSLSPKE